MKCISLWLFLVLFLLVVLPVSSLTPSEREILPQLKKEALIEIILILDDNSQVTEKNLIERELTLDEREGSLNAREFRLEKRENDCERKEESLSNRERLLVQSSQTHQTEKNSSFWKGFTLGAAASGGLTLLFSLDY